MIGAILTQNTSWSNVEKAIEQFEGNLTPNHILTISIDELQRIIRPAGFYKQKSVYIKAMTEWFATYNCDYDSVRRCDLSKIRSELLNVRGIGDETADSILLYAFDFPSFVVDAYTLRLFGRIPINAGKTYMEVKKYCEDKLPHNTALYNHFHALIVQNGKEHCRKRPNCCGCPLSGICKKIIV